MLQALSFSSWCLVSFRVLIYRLHAQLVTAKNVNKYEEEGSCTQWNGNLSAWKKSALELFLILIHHYQEKMWLDTWHWNANSLIFTFRLFTYQLHFFASFVVWRQCKNQALNWGEQLENCPHHECFQINFKSPKTFLVVR